MQTHIYKCALYGQCSIRIRSPRWDDTGLLELGYYGESGLHETRMGDSQPHEGPVSHPID